MADTSDLEQWLSDANDALTISLVSPTSTGVKPVASFHPNFTYSIFGDDEKIFGYKDLKISLRFRANDMRPHLKVSYQQKFKPSVGEDEPTDVAALLEQGHLPKVAFVKGTDFENSSKQLVDNWHPPGTLQSTLSSTGEQYEVWRGSLADSAFKQLNSRIQILVPLFIEGGSYIGQRPDVESSEPDLSDADRWTVFLLYKTQQSQDDSTKKTYTFVGYATVYRFYFFQPPTPPSSPNHDWELPSGKMDMAELPCRARLSQFLILPPFQGKGHGARLYEIIFQHYLNHAQTHELTVENPNESFDDLRDICDLAYLRTVPKFNALCLDTDVTIPTSGILSPLIKGADGLEAIRRNTKIAPRQFNRVLEMHLMSLLPSSVRPSLDLDRTVPSPTEKDKHAQKVWQLIVKQRLYRHNKEVLSQIEAPDRIDHLSKTLMSVEMGYARLLAAFDRRGQHVGSESRDKPNDKRKVPESSDERPTKKAKVGNDTAEEQAS